MGANCEESAGGKENGYDWMMGERERERGGEREREREREGGSDLASLSTIQLKYVIM